MQPLEGEVRAGAVAQQALAAGAAAPGTRTEALGHGEHPLADGQRGQDVVGQVGGDLGHAAGVAGETDAAPLDASGPADAFTFDNPDFTTSALRGTAVLRWEYRPGSTLYFVWTQERAGDDPEGDFVFGRARSAIFRQRPLNVFQVKVTYWFGR